ncbi:L,D-transpeptidase family protein [Ramlibacter sp. CrO1]|uniref:L,D-transpeptidase family protein n=2 Tax=Ramlibacter algicola TaxID=2795217 RepID=A0A934Q1M0_9BURK|nr:L,D-transpeptidase family protein [Ramlibacter algicola]MBK0392957.1 L,D-transpeptidase family protein [Ramlibacter algicola]
MAVLPSQAGPRHKARAASTPAKQVARDGETEARLIEVYRLIGAGNGRQALARAEALVKDHPTFGLAQLVYGDLLMAQVRPLRQPGDMPDGIAANGAQALAELREESQLRIRALRERPPAGAVPSQFLQLSPSSKHAIAVDTSRARLYLFENSEAGLKLVADYYISVGRLGIDKNAEGDLRTPLGVYYVTSNLDPRSLKDFYGSGALPINYPNPYDLRRGKTGGGIWLHGTPPNLYSRAPKATDGCVVLANPDLERVIRTVEVRSTPVVIAPSLRWVAPSALQGDARSFADTLAAWRAARKSGDVDKTLAFYTPDFSANGKTLAQSVPQLRTELERLRGRSVELKDLSYLRWTDSADTMVVTFGEVPAGARTGPVRRQYWVRQGSHWKIFFEGVIG